MNTPALSAATESQATASTPSPALVPNDAHSNQHWKKGLWAENAALVKLLGLCPLLAVSNSMINGLALGIATLITVTLSSLVVSATRRFLHQAVRLPFYVLIIASTVTALELITEAWLPRLYQSLGIFLPLIVTNCLIIGHAEAYAARHSVYRSGIDALAVGSGFLLVLVSLGGMREILGHGTLLRDAHGLLGSFSDLCHPSCTLTLLPESATILIALLPPGAFILLGLMLAVKNRLDMRVSSSV